ncbi:MAG TPA: sulfite exporter TauE/SafE family protein [Planctomycetota bacterium]|nr:sulfite exporter TauE/SafE family protein [Planctomycetota bacterium]
MDFIHDWIVPPEANVGVAEYIIVSIIALALTAVSKGGFGGGVGVLSVPLMLQVAPSVGFVVGMWLQILIVCDACTIRHYPKEWNPKAFWKLAPGMLVGITIATIYMAVADLRAGTPFDNFLKVSVAVISVVFLYLQLFPAKVSDEPWVPTWGVSIPTGMIAGITTTIAHAAGPIITMFLLPQKMEPRVYMGTCGRFFFIFNSLKVPFNIASGLLIWPTLKYGIWLMILSPLGVWLGAYLNSRMSAKWFVRVVQFSLVIAAGKLVYDVVK